MLKQNMAIAFMVVFHLCRCTSCNPGYLCTDRAKPQQQLLLGPHEGYTTAVLSAAGSCFGWATLSFGFCGGDNQIIIQLLVSCQELS